MTCSDNNKKKATTNKIKILKFYSFKYKIIFNK